MRSTPFALRTAISIAVGGLLAVGCISDGARSNEGPHGAVAVGPSEGTELWFQPSSSEDVGEGSVLTLKIDRISVPNARLMVASQRLGAAGIPVHAHTFEDEILYVVKGHGFALVGERRDELPLEPGSLLYVPMEEWHGVRNADPNDRMEILAVTTPAHAGGLADFFRNASSLPGHPPLNLPEEKLLELFREYGMRVPTE
jgi:mannose-6-phosphate isomerase-like protein (cupin superfamily)